MNKIKHNCDNINCNHNDTKGLCCLYNPDNCKYRQLQKENAELKEALKGKRCNCMTYFNFKDLEKQLTKAKELLKRFIETSNPIYFEEDRQKVKAEAEQFLKESEVEK